MGCNILVYSFTKSLIINMSKKILNKKSIDFLEKYIFTKNKEIFDFIKDTLDFDQLIFEFGTKDAPDWVHVSYNAGKNRKQVLRALKVNGKTAYAPYK